MQRHSLTSWFPHTTLVIKDHNFFVEHPIDFNFSGSNVMLLKYYKRIRGFSGNEQTVRNYVCFFKTSFKKVIFFGLLRVPMMTLPRQPVFSVSMVTFLSLSYQQLRISGNSRTQTFQYNGLKLREIKHNYTNFPNNLRTANFIAIKK